MTAVGYCKTVQLSGSSAASSLSESISGDFNFYTCFCLICIASLSVLRGGVYLKTVYLFNLPLL